MGGMRLPQDKSVEQQSSPATTAAAPAASTSKPAAAPTTTASSSSPASASSAQATSETIEPASKANGRPDPSASDSPVSSSAQPVPLPPARAAALLSGEAAASPSRRPLSPGGNSRYEVDSQRGVHLAHGHRGAGDEEAGADDERRSGKKADREQRRFAPY
jgi:hypothetical protein